MAAAFSRTKVAKYVASELDKGADPKELAKYVAGYLIDSGKSAEVNSLVRDVMESRAEESGYVELETSSAYPLTPEQKTEIEKIARQQYPGAKDIVIHHTVDPKSIGGVNISFPHSQLDLSVRTKLNRLRSAIIK